MREVGAQILPGESLGNVVHLLETDPARWINGVVQPR